MNNRITRRALRPITALFEATEISISVVPKPVIDRVSIVQYHCFSTCFPTCYIFTLRIQSCLARSKKEATVREYARGTPQRRTHHGQYSQLDPSWGTCDRGFRNPAPRSWHYVHQRINRRSDESRVLLVVCHVDQHVPLQLFHS